MPYKDPAANIEKIRKSRREWYYRNKGKQRVYKNKRDLEIRDWFKDLKSSLKCNRCSEQDVCTLDFHHIDPAKKDRAVGQTFANGWSKERILKEIEKCEVLCSNCHRKEHARLREQATDSHFVSKTNNE